MFIVLLLQVSELPISYYYCKSSTLDKTACIMTQLGVHHDGEKSKLYLLTFRPNIAANNSPDKTGDIKVSLQCNFCS